MFAVDAEIESRLCENIIGRIRGYSKVTDEIDDGDNIFSREHIPPTAVRYGAEPTFISVSFPGAIR